MDARLTTKDVERLSPGDKLATHPDEDLDQWEVDTCTFVSIYCSAAVAAGFGLYEGNCLIAVKNSVGKEHSFFCGRFIRKRARDPMDKIIEIWT